MDNALPWFVAWPIMGGFIALPALAAAHRRRASRDIVALALELAAFAAAVRDAQRRLPLDDALQARIMRLRIVDTTSLHLAQELDRAEPGALADIAQRLSSRLRRRVAFERMMLARTAPGLRRGAIAASVPPLLIVALQTLGVTIPAAAQLALLMVEAMGCLLLWRLAHVEV